MSRTFAIVALLVMSAGAYADDVYDIRPLSEGELLTMYESLMRDAVRHAESEWHDWPAESRAGHWGSGRSDQTNEGIRAIAEMVLTCATLLKHADGLSDTERQGYLAKATAAIRYAVSTHVTGTQDCTDGKKWGGSWQSAYWAGTMGFGAWLIWDDLDSELRQGVERVVASEADRFLAGKPPAGRWGDTKAEETGWNLICISVAASMFPSHAHAAAWDEKAIEYMMNTLSVPQDLQDGTLVDGRPVSEWVSAENLHPDFTLENHNFFHPAYVECSSYFLTQAAMHYTYAGRPIPQAATHHLMDAWQMLQTFMLPCGESAFPQGMDWELHGLPNINLLGALGTYMKDPLAAGMEKIVLQRMRAWQGMQDGNLAVPGSRLGFTRHAICAEQAAYGYLAHKLYGPPAEETTVSEAASRLKGVRNFESVGILTYRTESMLLSLSWKNRIMGMLVPIGAGHLGNPHFRVPILNGLVGSVELSAAGEMKTETAEHTWSATPTGLETTGTLLTNGGQLRQELRVTSVGEKTVVYQDRVSALSDASIARELGVPIGIENDRLSGGKRTVHHRDGTTVFDWQEPQPPAAIPGPWANVDGRLGVVTVAGSGLTYIQATEYNAQAVYTDILYGSLLDQPRDFKVGEEVARRIVLFFVEVTPEETATLSQSVRIEDGPDGQVLRFALPEGGEGEVSLL